MGKFSEASLPEKEDFYSDLNMEDITDANYTHRKKVCKDFETENLGEYYDLHVKSNALLLADIYANFRNTCLEIHKFNPVLFLTGSGLT